MALVEAIKKQDLEKITTIFSQISLKRKKNAFKIACKFGSAKVAEHIGLLEKNVLKQDSYALNQLTAEAMANGHEELKEYLMSIGGTFVVFIRPYTEIAAGNGFLDTVKFFNSLEIERGIKESSRIDTALVAAAKGGHLHIIEYLVSIGANIRDEALIEASGKGHLQVVKYLKYSLASCENQCAFLAAKNGHLEVVKYFISNGVNMSNYITYASEYGHLPVVKYLCESGANIHVNDNHAIQRAAINGHYEVVKYLYEAGADITARYNLAVQLAAYGGHLHIVKYLCEHGSPPQSAVMCASSVDVIMYLCEVGANIITADSKNSIIGQAAENSSLEMVKYLYKSGASLQSPYINRGVSIAIRRRKFDIVKYLYDNGMELSRYDKNYNMWERYISFCEKMKHKIRERAQKRIYFWWIPICYDVNREIGKRMMKKNVEKAIELGLELI